MTTPKVTVDGARDLRKALRAVDGGLADLKGVHAAAAQVVETRARQIVPRRSGLLAGSLRSSGQNSGGVVRAGRTSVPYAGVIHFGWRARNIRPRPFLYDALDDRARQVIDVYEDRVGQVIRKHGLD